MATLTVRDLDDQVKRALRVRAARNGRSMEAEVRAILQDAVRAPASTGLASRIRSRFAELGGLDLEPPVREEEPRAVDLT